MKVLSLFSGVGGFDMGLENAGMQTVFQCEWDKHANTILNKHWPQVPKWEDVSTLTGKHILTHAPVIDVVAWGSPCQDLSVAGKRSGLEGERSGLFHEGIRIIKELRKETNGQYPRISIWENVVGALNSNRGADFGIIINEMAEAGAMVIEWAVLDAQHFGVPQRRRRVFVIAIFDPVLAEQCPDPLLPVAESLPGHLAKGKSARKSASSKTAKSIRTSSSDNHLTDEQSYAESSFAQFREGDVAALKASGGVLGGGSETLIVGALTVSDLTKQVTNEIVSKNLLQVVQPFVKSSRAQTSDDSETWVEGAINPTLNSFDQGDVRATTAIVFENSYRDGARIADDGVTQTLSAKMGTGGGNTPMIAIPIQDGRDIEKHQNGLGVGDEHSPAYTIDQTGAQAVAYGIQGSMIGRQDHNGPAGKGHTEEGDPMFTLTSTDVHAVIQGKTIQYDGYNQTVNTTDVSQSLRIGRDSSDFIAQPTEPTMAVRRLTPLECERLMGWPDDHTRWKADGTEQADTHRYKQCGNGVASPVAQWIAKHLLKLEEQK
ncbi:MAG: DNA (cytosine-5-)-methyltransferase [Micrococcales bacterium]|nr:DNA (cytosine-5-)-methyltransferase [Micrococcales bacterium]